MSRVYEQGGYNGNPNIKRAGFEMPFTQEEVQEYIRCSQDIDYFCEKYIKVIQLGKGIVPLVLREYQKDVIDIFAKNRFSIIMQCRQSGKSTVACAYIMWYAIFHPTKKIAILANKAATAREMLSRISLMLENLPFFLQPGVREFNKGNIVFAHDGEILAASTSSSAIRGLSIDLVFLDEFAFVHDDETFYTSVYPVISSGDESKVIITSTPNGVGNMFYKIWDGSVRAKNKFINKKVIWSDMPGRDEAWKEETISNTSPKQFAQEYECAFAGSSNTLIDANTLLGLMAHDPEFIYHDCFRVYEEPVEGHDYIMTVDVSKGIGADYSTFTVFDISREDKVFRTVATFRTNMISPLMFPDYIVRAGNMYNEALVIIENNDQGGVVCNQVYYELEYENMFVTSSVKSNGLGVTMTKSVKRIGCSNLKDLIENGQLHIVDRETITELASFVEKGASYAAQGSTNDDMVMNLVMFGWFVSTEVFGGMSNLDVKAIMYQDRVRAIEEDIPLGPLFSGTAELSDSMLEMKEQFDEWQDFKNL